MKFMKQWIGRDLTLKEKLQLLYHYLWRTLWHGTSLDRVMWHRVIEMYEDEIKVLNNFFQIGRFK